MFRTTPLGFFVLVLFASISGCASTRPAEESAAQIIQLTMSPERMQEAMTAGMGMAGSQLPESMVDAVTEFMNEYLDFESLQADFVEFYVSEYTAEELSELAEFYASDLGQKTIDKQTRMGMKSAQRFQQLMVDHRAEFMEMVQNAMQSPSN